MAVDNGDALFSGFVPGFINSSQRARKIVDNPMDKQSKHLILKK